MGFTSFILVESYIEYVCTSGLGNIVIEMCPNLSPMTDHCYSPLQVGPTLITNKFALRMHRIRTTVHLESTIL